MNNIHKLMGIAALALLTAGALAAPAPASAPESNDRQTLAQANAALQAGEADKALELLAGQAQSGPDAAKAQNIECRVRYVLGQWTTAARECAQAVQLDPQDSSYRMWLGRALGEEADNASFLSAYSLSKQARAEMETAVRLDPRNAEALADLGEFYTEAPGVVGGGIDKAEGVAAQLDKVDPAQADELRGRIAAAQKDYATAEREYKAAIAASAHPAFQWSSLASFYRHRQEWSQMEWAIRNCASAAARDRTAGVALYDGASVLIQANREPALAARMLGDYLASPSKTEEGPAFVAHLWLARLKQQLGDQTGAQQEMGEARALAGDYKPQKDFGA
ncbi:MAG: tetratricopeptide repeat protein [Terracidiphilus sp.]